MRPALFALLLLPATAAAQPADARAAAVAPYLDPLTFAVVHIDLSRIDIDATLGKAADLFGLTTVERDAVRSAAVSLTDRLTKAGVRDVYAVASLAYGFPTPGFVIVPGADPVAVGAALGLPAERINGAVVAGPPPTLARLKALKPTPRPDLEAAFAAAGDAAARVSLLPPDDLRRSAEELLPTLPAEWGGGSTRTLTRGVRWATLGLDVAPKLALRLTVQAADAEAAKAVGDQIANAQEAVTRVAAKAAGGRLEFGGDAQMTAIVMSLLKFAPAEGNRLTAAVDANQLLPFVGPMVMKAREASARKHSMNNFKQLALCMHNYHDTYGHMPPPAIRSKDGKPLLSWRVAVLKFLEPDAQALYAQFRLDEPWDSDHNKALLPKMPAVFRSPFQTGTAGTTAYLVPVGDATIFPPAGPGVPLKEIADGTSNTILIVEADDAHAVPWTKPDDVVIDPKKPFAGLRVVGGNVILAAFGDGSVRAIRSTVGDKDAYAMFTRNGLEVIAFE